MKFRDERHGILVPARLDAGGPIVDVQIRNVSPRGMMVKTSLPLRIGTYVEITTGEVSAVGRVRWSGENCVGIQTCDRVPVVRLVFKGAGKLVRDTPSSNATPATAVPVVQQADRSRMLGRAIDFALVGIGVVAIALVIAGFAFGTLARPFATVSALLH